MGLIITIVRKTEQFLYPEESGPEVNQGPAGTITYPASLGPVLVWTQQCYLNLLKIVR